MKYLFLLLFVLPVWILNAQPLGGHYTVGGASPDFITLQNAADALKHRGVSDPVFMNIRPGTYMRDDGLGTVMVLDSITAGVSPANRITFQPDEAAGGTVENVILQIDQTTQTSTALVSIQTDYVTIRNLTFQDVDSAEAGADYLLSITNTHPYNPTNEGIIVEGCRFVGNPYPTGGMVLGTDFGIVGTWAVSDIVIRRNSFQQLMRSVDVGYIGTAGSGRSYAGNVIVEENEILKAHFGVTGAGGLRGHGILVQAHNAIVRRNYLNNAGGMGSNEGIWVMADSGLVERNTIVNGGGAIGSGGGQNPYYYGIDVRGLGVLGGQAHYTMVVNNMISRCTSMDRVIGIYVDTKKAKIVHNTIVNSGGWNSSEIYLDPPSDSCTVFNNIMIEYGSSDGHAGRRIIFNQDWGMSGLISDYNVFYFSDPLALIATRGPNRYSSLNEYQTATGLDTNSIFKEIHFEISENYPHLTDCQAQDPMLGGIPYPGMVDDIDGDRRSFTAPTRGADEGSLRSNPMFVDIFRQSLPGTAFSIAVGKFDNLMADGLAVSDFDNNQILLYHNLPSTRSFVHSGTLQTDFVPTIVKFFDLDDDGHLDLVVGGQASKIIKVFWGDGAGGFAQSVTITTKGGVASIDTGAVSFLNLRTIILTENVAPDVSFLCFLLNGNGRNLQHATVQRPLGGLLGGNVSDTLDAALYDIAVGDLDGNGSHEVAALGIDSWGTVTPFIVFVDTSLGNHPWGHHNLVHGFNTASFVGHNSNIIMDKFTGGSLADIIATGGDDDECILLRNRGNLNFSAEPISTHSAVGLAALDYDNDGDPDFVTINWDLENDGVSVFLNDGAGHFIEEFNCFQNFGSGRPYSVVASDFDLDGKTDLAIVSQSAGGHDSLFVLYNFSGGTTGVGYPGEPGEIPKQFVLEQNYPNPFNASTIIRYQLPIQGKITLKVYNVLGKEVATLVDGYRSAGSYEVEFDATNVASGIYFYRLQYGSSNQVKKMLLTN